MRLSGSRAAQPPPWRLGPTVPAPLADPHGRHRDGREDHGGGDDNAAQNASTVTPACSISPRSVPGLIGWCLGPTTVRLPCEAWRETRSADDQHSPAGGGPSRLPNR